MFDRLRQGVSGFRESVAWHRLHGPRAPKAGDLAPDFELRDAKGVSPVRLSQFQGERPVALVFGSWT